MLDVDQTVESGVHDQQRSVVGAHDRLVIELLANRAIEGRRFDLERLDLPPQRLAHEAGEQPRAARRHLARGVHLIHQQLQEVGRAHHLQLPAACQPVPDRVEAVRHVGAQEALHRREEEQPREQYDEMDEPAARQADVALPGGEEEPGEGTSGDEEEKEERAPPDILQIRPHEVEKKEVAE